MARPVLTPLQQFKVEQIQALLQEKVDPFNVTIYLPSGMAIHFTPQDLANYRLVHGPRWQRPSEVEDHSVPAKEVTSVEL